MARGHPNEVRVPIAPRSADILRPIDTDNPNDRRL
jgi:hypothetical protein